jgi:hypothetical protein
MSVLKENGFDLNPNSVFSLLKRMPIARNKRAILSTRELEDYVPYSKRQIDDAERYKQALKIFSSGKTIAETSRLVNKPWSTVRDWVYNVTRPSPLHGPWKAAIESD